MKLSSVVNLDENLEELINPIYEEKAISALVQALIRFIDIVCGLIGIFVLIPTSLYVIINRIVSKESGSFFYYEKRIGKNGKIFNMYKLNTKSIISDFPQFINLLGGSMTLVGPRPYTLKEKQKMGAYFNIISTVKPGITGIYQITGRNIKFEERLDLDLKYILNCSLKLNIKIILITLLVTVKNKEGRYYQKYIYEEIPKDVLNNYALKSIKLFIKRVLDIIVSIVGCIFIIPLSIIVKISYMLTGDFNSIFYTQERIGKNGRVFKMIKYRTMVVNSDEIFEKIVNDEKYKKDWELYHKFEKDPRITKVGRILRITSLDEIPQILNILKGEMSLIGNRPYMLKEKKAMGEYYEDIIKTKPGLTGVWQISGRSKITFNDRLILESDYSNNCSFILDLKILLKTVGVVFRRTGSK